MDRSDITASGRHNRREPDALDIWFLRQRRSWWRQWWWLVLTLIVVMVLACGYELVADINTAYHTAYRGGGGVPTWSGFVRTHYQQALDICQLLQIACVAGALLLQVQFFKALLPDDDLLLAIDERSLIRRLKAKAVIQPLLVVAFMVLGFHIAMYSGATWIVLEDQRLSSGAGALTAQVIPFFSMMTLGAVCPGICAALGNALVCLVVGKERRLHWAMFLPAAFYLLYWLGLYSLHRFGTYSIGKMLSVGAAASLYVLLPVCVLMTAAIIMYSKVWRLPGKSQTGD